jgi:hypothetical protein
MQDDLTLRALAALEACSSSSDEEGVTAVCNPAIAAPRRSASQTVAASNWNKSDAGSAATAGKQRVEPVVAVDAKYSDSTKASNSISVASTSQYGNGLIESPNRGTKSANVSNENQKLVQNPIESGAVWTQPIQKQPPFARATSAELARKQSLNNVAEYQHKKHSGAGQIQFGNSPSVRNRAPSQQQPAADKRQRIAGSAGSAVLSMEKTSNNHKSRLRQTAPMPSPRRQKGRLKSFAKLDCAKNAKLPNAIPGGSGQSGKTATTQKLHTKHLPKASLNNFQRSISQSSIESQLQFTEDIITPHNLSSKHYDVMKLYTSTPFDCRTMTCLHQFKEFDRPLHPVRYENEFRTMSQKYFIRKERDRRIDCMECELLDDVESCINGSILDNK